MGGNGFHQLSGSILAGADGYPGAVLHNVRGDRVGDRYTSVTLSRQSGHRAVNGGAGGAAGASPTTLSRCGFSRITSRAWVPMEPVGPSRRIERGSVTAIFFLLSRLVYFSSAARADHRLRQCPARGCHAPCR